MAINYEGFGAQAIGGANSTDVRHVTSAAQFTAALGSNRTIIFDNDVTLTGTDARVSIVYSYLTVDANGHNVTFDNGNNGDGFSFNGTAAHHCIGKGIRVINAGNDGINAIDGAHDILITNCSSYDNRDGNIDIAGDTVGQTKNVTVQYCILGRGNTGWSGDMLITSQNVSVHHNLFIPATAGQVGERAPFVHCNYSPVGAPNADIRNNVFINWGRSGGTGSGYATAIGYNATGNVVNNYYYDKESSASAIANGDGYGTAANGKIYSAGNVITNGTTVLSASMSNNHTEYPIAASANVVITDACTAASVVLSNVGPAVKNATEIGWINSVTLSGCSAPPPPPPPPNNPPTANAGADKTLVLPNNSTTFVGIGTDTDGTIASYAWTKVSGGAATLAGVNIATLAVSGVVAGSYVLRLTVTDNKGATASDDVILTVTPAPNQAPTVSAGADQTIKLPVNSVTVSGTAADSDGSIVSTVWSKVSGNGGAITNANSLSTDITGLTEGIYVYRITATDNAGATATSDLTVTVQPADIPAKTIISVVVNYSDGSSQTII